MERRARNTILSLAVLLTATGAVGAPEKAPPPAKGQTATPVEWRTVEQIIGKTGAMQPGDVFKIGLPRADLKVKVGDVAIRPALALGSWLAWKRMEKEVMVMGDLVLTEDEVGPVMARLQQSGIEQTALHNHVFNESPRVMYMHVGGHGDATKLAEALRAALALSKTPLGPAPAAAAQAKLDLDTRRLDEIIGHAGKPNGGVYQFGVPRAEKVREGGVELPTAMGLATALNFQPTGGGKAAITGDFVLLASEVNPVIRALREHGIEVTALHNHMLMEEPRLFFMHFWANDDAQKLARGLRAALDRTNSAKGAAK